MRIRFLVISSILLGLTPAASAAQLAVEDSAFMAALEWRSVGDFAT